MQNPSSIGIEEGRWLLSRKAEGRRNSAFPLPVTGANLGLNPHHIENLVAPFQEGFESYK
jgi:hypothetical protein